ncbi:hypothetical protein N7931_15755 [Catenovulum sp. 2E275]|uniref:hypothetical protein n=1 Tax=Catenovulum sp. 2E275 TaxID=2980497 RepID=UPI0021D1B05C|nr:hypothetical protein [Catenovulum sp. 2E275]MCU4677089.1 hypothetical protein [Catenovulum sp. 2E275]
MAYDFGANTLGIKNPFKTEGLIKTIAGLAICIMGIFPLLDVAEALQVDMVKAWLNAALGLILLTWGFRHLGIGLFQLFKYFVGRSVPTSLAYNFNPSEKENAQAEKNSTAYDNEELESMLMGRKNTTFVEPIGWVSRLIHSVLPKLVFLPYPMRNFVQELGGLVLSSFTALIAFAIAYFISLSGLVGQSGQYIVPILSLLLLIYLTVLWRSTANSLTNYKNRSLHAKGAASLAKLITIAILVPVAIGYLFSQIDPRNLQDITALFDGAAAFSAWFNLILFLLLSGGVIGISAILLKERFKLVTPVTEVSEYRENLQESVHPNEIFINIENIVLANRRYKEIPNRVYQDFDPKLQEQSQGKGSFKGKLLIETQPELADINYSKSFKTTRLLASIAAQVLVVIAALLVIRLFGTGYDLYASAQELLPKLEYANDETVGTIFYQLSDLLASFLVTLFSWQAVSAAGKILANGSRLFWAEIHFSSLLMWMKTEGTYTESKISTGMSIHDSTRSENVVVRSSITPWILSSRIRTSTFATSGTQNLEMPRYILELTKNSGELNTIIDEIKGFLKNREAIASIQNEGDLKNAETIYQVNQQSRVQFNEVNPAQQEKLTEEAAGYLRQQEALEQNESRANNQADNSNNSNEEKSGEKNRENKSN